MKDEPVRILIADDETPICRLIERILRGTGWNYQLEAITKGLEVVEKTKTFKPDLILLDINMPGKSGYAICDDLCVRDNSKSPVVLAISGDGSDETRDNILQAGATDLLSKPFTREELLEMLKKICPALTA